MREPGDLVRCKGSCCKSRPRCKRCPTVWKRLAKQGYAEREGKLRYVVIDVMPKRVVKSARH
ncbi:MAG TPA: hypothetical protein VEY49_01030 [Solirubrobacteraceae bacterium]|jgi:hypothetical protein|nr:hypothetical protein [Solirubrobacteraceae bacterium]